MAIDRYDNSGDASPGERSDGPRRFIGVLFECCGVYARVYRRADQSVYVGRCPRCLRTLRVRVGPGGTDERFFRAE